MNKSIFRMRRYYILNTTIIGMILCIYLLTASTDIHSVMGEAGVSPYMKGDASKRQAAIAVHVDTDDTAMVQDMMDILMQADVPATFFVHREFAAAHAETLQALVQNGFEIGSMGSEDMHPVGQERSKVLNDLISTEQEIARSMDKPLKLYCPLNGEYTRETLSVAASLNYKTVLWSIDAVDPYAKDASAIVARATQKLHNGAIIRLNVTELTLEALPSIIQTIKEKDYVFKTVGTLIQ
ncbi:MAG: polysaccharide deacetylase family protein [Bacillota bacterium]